MRPLAGLLAALLLAAAVPAAAEPIAVSATPVPLNPDDPGDNQVGRLVYRGGLVLRSDDPRFGGFSALGVSADGTHMVSLSDHGTSLAATLVYGPNGDLTGIGDADLVPLTDPDGRALVGKEAGDAESMAPGVNGDIIVSFERHHRIWAYPPGDTHAQPIRPPDGLRRLPANNGVEALALLDDGRLLAIAEGTQGQETTIAWSSTGAGWEVMTYRMHDGFPISGAATLPAGGSDKGGVLVLERYYTPRTGVLCRIRRIAEKAIVPAAELDGPLVATFKPPLTVDNFEGIHARATDDGRTLVYLISDDNFNRREQRTLLLMFELEP